MAQVSAERMAWIDEELKKSERNYTKQKFLKIQDGQIRVRVLPGQVPASRDKDFFVEVRQHFGANPNNPKVPVTCPKSSDPNAKCPVCERVSDLRNGDKAAKAEAERMRTRIRYYMGVIPLEGDMANEVVIMTAPQSVKNDILLLMKNPEYGDVTDAIDGFNLTITRTGKELNTEYKVFPSRQPNPLGGTAEEIAKILEAQPDLWKYRMSPDVDEIERWMDGDITKFSTGPFARKGGTDDEDDEDAAHKAQQAGQAPPAAIQAPAAVLQPIAVPVTPVATILAPVAAVPPPLPTAASTPTPAPAAASAPASAATSVGSSANLDALRARLARTRG